MGDVVLRVDGEGLGGHVWVGLVVEEWVGILEAVHVEVALFGLGFVELGGQGVCHGLVLGDLGEDWVGERDEWGGGLQLVDEGFYHD